MLLPWLSSPPPLVPVPTLVDDEPAVYSMTVQERTRGERLYVIRPTIQSEDAPPS